MFGLRYPKTLHGPTCRRLVFAAFGALVAALGGPHKARAEAGNDPFAVNAKARMVSLEDCIALARANFPKVRAARARLDKRQHERFEARTAPFSEFQVVAGAGFVPALRGTAVYSPNTDASLTANMAVAAQAGIEGVIPLWTFGKLSSLWAATDAATEAGRHEVVKEQNDVELEVRRAYYGVLLARSGRRLLDEVRGELQRGVDRLQDKLKQGEGDETDVIKLSVYLAEIDARGSETVLGEQRARVGLRFFTGSPTPLDVGDLPLRRSEHELLPVTVYLEAARLNRPELNMVRAGLDARRALVALEKARYFPDLGVALAAKLSRAPDVADQKNPFAYDPFNAPLLGVAVALRWKVDFLPQSARVAKAQADLEEMRATESFALGGVATEVQEAYHQAVDAKRRLDAWHRAASLAKRWLIATQQGSDLGLVEDDELIDPAKEYALKRFSEMTAVFDYNVALARLAQTTGSTALLAQMDPKGPAGADR